MDTQINQPKLEDKGIYLKNCNRTACQKPHATYYNQSTRLYYCEECANKINDMNPESLEMFGSELCITNGHPNHPHYIGNSEPILINNPYNEYIKDVETGDIDENGNISKDKLKLNKLYNEVMNYMNGKYTLSDVYKQIQDKACPLPRRCRGLCIRSL